MGWLLLKALTLLVAAWLIVTWLGTAESADLRDAQWISHQRALRDAGELWDVPTPLRSSVRCSPPAGPRPGGRLGHLVRRSPVARLPVDRVG